MRIGRYEFNEPVNGVRKSLEIDDYDVGQARPLFDLLLGELLHQLLIARNRSREPPRARIKRKSPSPKPHGTSLNGDERVRILITGGGGFIASHLARALDRRGDTVLAVDLAFPELPTDPTKSNPPTISYGGVTDPGRVIDLASQFRPDVIVHTAALVGIMPSWLTAVGSDSHQHRGIGECVRSARARPRRGG